MLLPNVKRFCEENEFIKWNEKKKKKKRKKKRESFKHSVSVGGVLFQICGM